MVGLIEKPPIHLSLEEFGVRAGPEVLNEVNDNISLIVSNLPGIVDHKLRLYQICSLNIIVLINGTAYFKNVNNCLNTIIYFYLEISGGQSFDLYSNVFQIFNTSVD